MNNAKETRRRILSVKDTQKITNAMYLISSVKMRKAKEELNKTKPYFSAVKSEIKRIFRIASDIDSKYFYPVGKNEDLDGTFALLVITADKGLAGAYNQNVLKEAAKRLELHPDSKLYVVGEYGRQYFMRRKVPIEKSFLYTAQNPTLTRAREICDIMLETFYSGQVDSIHIIYTDLKNGRTTEVKSARIMPFKRSEFMSGEKTNEKFEDSPSLVEVLEEIMPSYVSGYIYSALVDSYCSEQQERMTAMDNANKNAEELLNELSLEYNRMRQAAVTQEITEVSAGAQSAEDEIKEATSDER